MTGVSASSSEGERAPAADLAAADPGAAAEPGEHERELTDSTVGGAPAVKDPTGGAAPAVPEPVRVVVPRWVQLVLLPVALLALGELAKAAGKVLVIFIVAGLIALILNPAVSLLHRTRMRRGIAVLAVYLAFFLTLAGIGFLVANPISDQVRTFADNLPHLVKEANKTIEKFQHELNGHGVHIELVKQGKTALQSIEGKVAKSADKLASFGGALATEVASAIFDLVLIFVLSVYMLVYGEKIGALVRRAMPDGDGSKADDFPHLVQRAVTRYVGGQLLFSTVMGASTGLALYLFGVLGIFHDGRTYAVAFAVFYGVMELVPYVGPILGAIPPVVVALFTKPITALWVALLFVGLQQLEGHVVAPQIFGHTLRINPLLVILALLLGLQFYGVFGALLALPILAVLRETAVYLSRHLTLERWDRGNSGML